MKEFNAEAFVDGFFGERATAVARDLKLNLKRILCESSLEPAEAMLNLLATATAAGRKDLAAGAEEGLRSLDFSSEQIREASEVAAIMGMLNTYYRFRYMVGRDEEYKSVGLRMTTLARPLLGKERFEMLALAVSILNGCETCIKAHEKVLRDSGISVEKLHDLARLAAVVNGVAKLA